MEQICNLFIYLRQPIFTIENSFKYQKKNSGFNFFNVYFGEVKVISKKKEEN